MGWRQQEVLLEVSLERKTIEPRLLIPAGIKIQETTSYLADNSSMGWEVV
jgi:hypothetical protein